MKVLSRLQFQVAFVHIISIPYFVLILFEGQLGRFEALIIRNFSPKLVSSPFERMVSQRLLHAHHVHEIHR